MLRLRVDGVDSVPVVEAATPVNPDEPAPISLDPTQTVVLS